MWDRNRKRCRWNRMACQTPKTLRVEEYTWLHLRRVRNRIRNFRIYHPSAQLLAAPFARACILRLRRLARLFWIWMDARTQNMHKTYSAGHRPDRKRLSLFCQFAAGENRSINSQSSPITCFWSACPPGISGIRLAQGLAVN